MGRRTVQPNIRWLLRFFDHFFAPSYWERERGRAKSATFWQWKVWTQRHLGGEELKCKFWQGKVQKLIANLALLQSVCLSLLLPSAPHTQYRKRFFASYYRKRGSASYIVREVLSVRERERERERYRERRKWRHHCRAKIGDEFTPSLKIRTIGDELTLSLAKNSHFSFLPSRRGHHCGAEICNEFTLSRALPKLFSTSFFLLLQMARAARRVIENPRQMIKSCPVLFCSSNKKKMNQINQKLLEIEKEIVREVARGVGVINLTWENLQIAKHKSGRRSFSLADWFVLCGL